MQNFFGRYNVTYAIKETLQPIKPETVLNGKTPVAPGWRSHGVQEKKENAEVIAV